MVPINKIIQTDCLHGLQSLLGKFIRCVVTSPPYWGLRDYFVTGQLGIIWHTNGVPESVKVRCTKTHKYIFLLTKSNKYYFDYKSIQASTSAKKLHDKTSRVSVKGFDSKLVNCFRKPGDPYEMVNRLSVWTITTKSFKGKTSPSSLRIYQNCVSKKKALFSILSWDQEQLLWWLSN